MFDEKALSTFADDFHSIRSVRPKSQGFRMALNGSTQPGGDIHSQAANASKQQHATSRLRKSLPLWIAYSNGRTTGSALFNLHTSLPSLRRGAKNKEPFSLLRRSTAHITTPHIPLYPGKEKRKKRHIFPPPPSSTTSSSPLFFRCRHTLRRRLPSPPPIRPHDPNPLRDIQQQQHNQSQHHQRRYNPRVRYHFLLGGAPIRSRGLVVAARKSVVGVWRFWVAKSEDAGEADERFAEVARGRHEGWGEMYGYLMRGFVVLITAEDGRVESWAC